MKTCRSMLGRWGLHLYWHTASCACLLHCRDACHTQHTHNTPLKHASPQTLQSAPVECARLFVDRVMASYIAPKHGPGILGRVHQHVVRYESQKMG